MTNKIPCSVIRDLLPSYMEKLTEKETDEVIKEHLSSCEKCRKLYESMGENTCKEEGKIEVDYLKKVKKKNLKKIVLSILATSFVFIIIALAQIFLIGTKVTDKPYEATINEEGNLEVIVFNPSSASVFTNIKTDISGNTATISLREALISPLHSKGSGIIEVPLEGIEEVQMFGKVIWQKGSVISNFANILYLNKTPYIGSMPDVGRLTRNLRWPYVSSINLLHTSEEPYGFEVIYEEEVDDEYILVIKKNAVIATALVENMGEFIITSPKRETIRITESAINENLPKMIESYNEKHKAALDTDTKIKDFAGSPYMVQTLLDILEY